jgi:hypothetical protein
MAEPRVLAQDDNSGSPRLHCAPLGMTTQEKHKRKRPHVIHMEPLFMSATTYSPTHFRVQYNRPSGA